MVTMSELAVYEAEQKLVDKAAKDGVVYGGVVAPQLKKSHYQNVEEAISKKALRFSSKDKWTITQATSEDNEYYYLLVEYQSI